MTANVNRAAVYTGIEQIEIREFPQTSPPPGFIQVNTQQVGICGSDLHNYFGEWKASDAFALGHETCGTVTAIGEGVTGFELGDFVAIECFSHCGTCINCRTGGYNHCLSRKWVSENQHGGFSEYTTAHASGIFKLPDDMTPEEGAMVEPLAVAVRTLAQARATHNDSVLIIGGGTIGQLCLAVAIANGVKETAITVKYEQQAELARELGADHVIMIKDDNGDYVDIKPIVKEMTNGLGMDVVIETVGTAQNFDDSLAVVRNRGTVVLVAGYHKPLEVNLARAVWSEAIIVGSNCYGYSGMVTDFDAAIEMIASGKVEATKLVTHRYSFDEIAEAFRVSADKSLGAIKVHVQV